MAEIGHPGARFVLARGRGSPIPRPKGMRKGHTKGCYSNAAVVFNAVAHVIRH
jgi:hypothetical protein